MENRIAWRDTKRGKFSVEVFYSFLPPGGSNPFPVDVVWNLWILTREIFYMDSYMERDFDVGSVEKERFVFKEQMFHV